MRTLVGLVALAVCLFGVLGVVCAHTAQARDSFVASQDSFLVGSQRGELSALAFKGWTNEGACVRHRGEQSRLAERMQGRLIGGLITAMFVPTLMLATGFTMVLNAPSGLKLGVGIVGMLVGVIGALLHAGGLDRIKGFSSKLFTFIIYLALAGLSSFAVIGGGAGVVLDQARQNAAPGVGQLPLRASWGVSF